jgi:MFS family permease
MYTDNAKNVFRLVTTTACMSSYFIGCQLTTFSVVMAKLLSTTTEYVIFTALMPIGAVLGVFVGRYLMNEKGRRLALIIGNIIGSIGCILCAGNPNRYILGIGRFACGLGAGVGNLAAPFYIKEIIPMTYSSAYLL